MPQRYGHLFSRSLSIFFGFSQIILCVEENCLSLPFYFLSNETINIVRKGSASKQQEALEDVWTALHHHSACLCDLFVLCSHHPYILLLPLSPWLGTQLHFLHTMFPHYSHLIHTELLGPPLLWSYPQIRSGWLSSCVAEGKSEGQIIETQSKLQRTMNEGLFS